MCGAILYSSVHIVSCSPGWDADSRCLFAVRFAMDRAGLVGADGATHCGFADIAYMGCLPNMVLMAVRVLGLIGPRSWHTQHGASFGHGAAARVPVFRHLKVWTCMG